jgi:hypothetical protein
MLAAQGTPTALSAGQRRVLHVRPFHAATLGGVATLARAVMQANRAEAGHGRVKTGHCSVTDATIAAPS